MKVSVLQENLAKGLSIVGRAVATKSTLPVLGNILHRSRRVARGVLLDHQRPHVPPSLTFGPKKALPRRAVNPARRGRSSALAGPLRCPCANPGNPCRQTR